MQENHSKVGHTAGATSICSAAAEKLPSGNMHCSTVDGQVLLMIGIRAAADEESSEDEGEKTKTVKETVWDWEVLNDNKAIWLRNPAEVTEDEYSSFFQALSKVCYMCHSHVCSCSVYTVAARHAPSGVPMVRRAVKSDVRHAVA